MFINPLLANNRKYDKKKDLYTYYYCHISINMTKINVIKRHFCQKGEYFAFKRLRTYQGKAEKCKHG